MSRWSAEYHINLYEAASPMKRVDAVSRICPSPMIWWRESFKGLGMRSSQARGVCPTYIIMVDRRILCGRYVVSL